MGFSHPLKMTHDPFGRGAPSPICGPVELTFAEVMREIGLGTAVIVVVGPAGSGKTLLLDMTERACDGRSTRRIERGDLAHTVLGECCDLLLVDEADSIDQATLRVLLSNEDAKRPGVTVFACRPPAAHRFVGSAAAVFVKLNTLAPSEARKFVAERASGAGRPDLFEQGALDVLVASSGGSPRLLQSIGSHALFFAAHEGAFQICPDHVEHALAAQLGAQNRQAEARSEIIGDHGSLPLLGPRKTVRSEEGPQMLTDATAEQAINAEAKLPIDASESQYRSRNRRAFVGSVFVLGLFLLPLLLSDSHGGGRVRAIPLNAQRAVESRSSTDTLRDMKRVAEVELPRRVVVAIIAPGPLQPLEIGGPAPRDVRIGIPAKSPRQATTKAMLRVKPATSQTSAHLVREGNSSDKSAAQLVVPPSRKSVARTVAKGPSSFEKAPDVSVRIRDASAAPSRLAKATSVRYLSSEQTSRIVFDIASRANLDSDREYPAFKSCVLKQVTTQVVEAEKFWNAVRRCAR